MHSDFEGEPLLAQAHARTTAANHLTNILLRLYSLVCHADVFK